MNYKDLPQFRCHKIVGALQIKGVERAGDGGGKLSFFGNYRSVELPKAFFDKHSPGRRSYFVVYKDGYQSISPEEAFKDGYTEITNT